MRALVLSAVGAAPHLEERPAPPLKPGEARVRVLAAALNRRDVWIQRGQYPGIHTPIILGSDGCGVVEAVHDEGVELIGQRVVLCPSLFWGGDPRRQGSEYQILGLPRDGTFAEQVVVPIEALTPWPSHLGPAEAAALPLAGLTAWRALMSRARLQAGERLLITGIGGGVSTIALQIAVAAGARVVVTSSSLAKIERAVGLGAVGGVRYTEEGWTQRARALAPEGFDVILDSAGGEGFGALPRLLAMGGRIVFYGGTRGPWPAVHPAHLFYKQASILGSTMGSPADFAALLAFVSERRLAPLVDRIFPLAEGAAAFAWLESGQQHGKVVLDMGAA